MSGMKNENEKIVIITGGTGALGRFVVNKFASENAKVYVPARNVNKFREIFDSSKNENSFTLRKIFSFECDASDEKSISEFIEKVAALEKRKIDILVNTIGGIHPPVKIGDLSSVEFEKNWNLNFKSAFVFSRESLKYMKENNYGRIVSIGAPAALEAAPERFPYSVSKASVMHLMDTINLEYESNNIKCFAVVPGIIDTPANREWGSKDDYKNWVKPDDIADKIFEITKDDFISESYIIKLLGKY
jgi:NAD(P)-dependent dehydrogenase (short-subunit alcohol dehydrogenase family)